VRPEDMYYVAWFALKDGMLVANGGKNGGDVFLWSYPSGGKANATLAHYPSTVRGLTVSSGN
jgi:hypothetical protein